MFACDEGREIMGPGGCKDEGIYERKAVESAAGI